MFAQLFNLPHRQSIDRFVELYAGVPFDLDPVHVVVLCLRVKALPKITIQNWFLVGFFPATSFPVFQPAVDERVDEIGAVGMEANTARFRECFER